MKIEPGDESFSLSINGSVAPLENLYRVTVLHPDDIKHHVERLGGRAFARVGGRAGPAGGV